VVIALPEDMLSDVAACSDGRPFKAVHAFPSQDDMMELQRLLHGAERPFMILGGGGWTAEAVADIQDFALKFDLPVGVSFRRQDYFDNRHPCYAGHVGISVKPPLSERIRAADLLILAGTRLGEASSQSYGLIDIPRPSQTLVQVHAAAEELGMMYQPELAIHAGAEAFAGAACQLEPANTERWAAETRRAHQQHLDSIQPPQSPGDLQFGKVVSWLDQNLPDDAIITNGAGNYCVWVNGYYQYKRFRTQLAPTSGSMGYGSPAAVAAKLVHPERTVIAFAGDGCLLMTGQEMATAAQYGLKVIWIVANNGMYGTIRMHQERDYPGRVSGTSLSNPDFAALARAYGGYGATVTSNEAFPEAFARCANADTFALLDLRLDPNAITPTMTIEQMRAAGS
jgi:acetolactate synthase-1/2/3 large subunit